MADINRIHVSPGVYASETVDMKAAANSLGITKLAVVGETLKGPAFQKYWVHSPKEYASVFGGTSPKKFAGSKYPKYELPYIANEFLKKGTELCVVRTLGFSGYNAGPAWVITGENTNDTDGEKYVIAVLRSRGTYKYREEYKKTDENGCPCSSAYDSMTFDVGEISGVKTCGSPISYNMGAVKLSAYNTINYTGSECTGGSLTSGTPETFAVSYGNFGRFTIECIVGPSEAGETPDNVDGSRVVKIPVSLNKSDKDFILNVLGTTDEDGDQPLFVESLYDVAWEDLVMNHGYDAVSADLAGFNVGYAADFGGLEPVNGLLKKYDSELSRKDLGKRYLCHVNAEMSNTTPSSIRYYVFDYNSNTPILWDNYDNVVKESLAEAQGDNTEIVIDGVFVITGDDYPGKYKNTSGQAVKVKDLVKTPTFGGSKTSYSVEKLEGVADIYVSEKCQGGYIYTVALITDDTGKKYYVYKAYDKSQTAQIESESEKIKAEDRLRTITEAEESNRHSEIVYNNEDGLYYKLSGLSYSKAIGPSELSTSGSGKTELFSCDVNALLYVYYKVDGNYIMVGDNYQLYKGTSNNIDNAVLIEREVSGLWKVQATSQGEGYFLYAGSPEISETIYTGGLGKSGFQETSPVTCDLNDYKSKFRYSSTPWVVSNAKGDASKIEVNKLFRFHTISDGAASSTEVKVSIENIRPDSGEFDVVVRSYNDIDSSVNVLERFSKCSMAAGTKNIAYKIGTIDGTYESKSKFITVEVAEGSAAANSVPAGFIGYSVPLYNGVSVDEPATIKWIVSGSDIRTIIKGESVNATVAPITYNTNYDEDVAKRKQYFGVSDRTGYDVDYFTFKGNMATSEDPGFVCHGFHLDCRLDKKSYGSNPEEAPKITVDGVEGYEFDTVSVNARTSSLSNSPIIASEEDMQGSIYEDIKLRKFTMAFAGGFDGWDIYRDQRTNTDEFSATSYKGYIGTTGVGYNFDIDTEAGSYGIEGKAITSDYYSTLAGVSLLKNTEEVDINVLATPGIDTVNNTKLVNEVFDVLEERTDTLYVVTTPDKDSGAGDYADDIPEVEDMVNEFVDKDLHSDYATTYYPWVKIEDAGEYVWIPATRDVVRNLAESDNTNTTMNLAPAGTTRGKVDAIKARKNLKNGESDELYENNLNPVRTYAQEGIVIMGQKTLRAEDDLLNRVDVRRMVMRMRKLIAIACLGLIFEPNDSNTVKSFKSIIAGVMQTFMDNRAIQKWTMEVDDSQEARDRLELNATIYVMPVRALEYITLNFVVTNNEVYFEA